MFRVTLSQRLPQTLNSLLSGFNLEADDMAVKIKRASKPMSHTGFPSEVFKRRRRVRRLAVGSGSSLRTTWF